MTLQIPLQRVVTTLGRKSGVEADAVQNVWHYAPPSAVPSVGDYGNWINRFINFIDGIHTGLSTVLGSGPGGCKAEFFNLPMNKPPTNAIGSPVYSTTFTLRTQPTNQGLPGEVCICLSLDGTTITDPERAPGNVRPAARKRNRKYIGPVAATGMTLAPTTFESRPLQSMLDTFVTTFITEMLTGLETHGWGNGVFSPTDWAWHPLYNVWADNEYDIQRRRGTIPDAKTLHPNPQAGRGFIDHAAKFGVTYAEDQFGHLVGPL